MVPEPSPTQHQSLRDDGSGQCLDGILRPTAGNVHPTSDRQHVGGRVHPTPGRYEIVLPVPEDEGAFAVGKGVLNHDPGEAHSRGEERTGGPPVTSEQGGPHRMDLR